MADDKDVENTGKVVNLPSQTITRVQSLGRGRRLKRDVQGKAAAFQRLKELKGQKNKINVDEVENVYEEVDEKEYSRRVQQRQEDDWIDDDDGAGYVEDGREVFDDDLDDENVAQASKTLKHKGKKVNSKGAPGKNSNIKNMIINMPSKNKEREAKIQDDDILGDIMQELNSTPSANTPQRSLVTTLKKKVFPGGQSVVSTPTSVPRNVGGTSSASRLVKAEPKRLPFNAGAANNRCDSPQIDDFESQDSPFVVEETHSISQVDSQNEGEISKTVNGADEIFSMDQTEDFTTASESQCTILEPSIREIPSSWDTMKIDTSNDVTSLTVDYNSTDLPLTTGEDGEQFLRMYWYDAYEDSYAQPGTVFLFGKVFVESAKAYVSCCVAVKKIPKHIFVLPREMKYDLKTGESTEIPVTFMDVYQEFDRVCERYKIMGYKSKRTQKKYAFEPPSIPRESEYLEVLFPAEHSIPANLKGSTFSHVFGTNASSLENFLLEKRIKGPCWLNIKCPQKPNAPISWCKIEAYVDDMNSIEITTNGGAPPPLGLMSLSLRTVVNSRTQQVEIVSIGCLVHDDYHIDHGTPPQLFKQHFCILSRPAEEPWPLDHREGLGNARVTKIDKAESERALLNLFLVRVNKIDPDIVVGHDISSYDLDILLHRLQQNKVPNWSRLGRLRRTQIPQIKGSTRNQIAMSGRIVCDIKTSARELIRARSYDLDTLCQQVLRFNFSRPDQSSEAIRKMYSSSASILKMVEITMQDSANILKIMCELNVLPLALQITSIAGNLLSRTLCGGRSERNEYLLLHAFHEKGYIVPDRQYSKKPPKEDDSDADDAAETTSRAKKGRRKPAYAGGLVLEPKKGFYDKFILLMDFNSLYPSIIQEFNICFTTVDRTQQSEHKEGDEDVLPELPDASLAIGILPTEIRKLVDSRREVKKLINDKLPKDLLLQYDIRQKALKLTANSMYGCLGFSNSRFYAKPLAALITAKGREILLQTRDLVRKMNLDVVYGDTDSLMIDSNNNDYEQVMKLGQKIKQEVNKFYKHLELDIDGVFQRLLLLKKKKYAAVTVSQVIRDNKKEMITQQEIKGLDIVRRDWSQLAIKSGRYALEQILGDISADERIAMIQQQLESIRTGFENGTIDLSLLEITKQLTKNPEQYPDAKNLSHVQVALRANSRGGKKLTQGDTVSFIICEDGSNMAATQRAYSLDELKMPSNSHLKPDKHYYLAQQVHPVVSRLCEHLEGIDAVRIAEFLGLDTSGYRASHQSSHNDYDPEDPPLNDEERFQSCEKFYFKCPEVACGMEMAIDNAFKRTDDGKISFALGSCGNPNCKSPPTSYPHILQNRLSQAIRKYIQSYYSGWLLCEDKGCAQRTRRLPLKSVGGRPVCTSCGNGNMQLEYTDQDLYTQLCYFKHIFDVEKAKKKLQGTERDQIAVQYTEKTKKAYLKLLELVNSVLSESAYSQVNLASLFYSVQKAKTESNA